MLPLSLAVGQFVRNTKKFQGINGEATFLGHFTNQCRLGRLAGFVAPSRKENAERRVDDGDDADVADDRVTPGPQKEILASVG